MASEIIILNLQTHYVVPKGPTLEDNNVTMVLLEKMEWTIGITTWTI